MPMMTDEDFDRGIVFLKKFAEHENTDEIRMMALVANAVTRHLFDLTKQLKRLADHLAGPEIEPEPPPAITELPKRKIEVSKK